MKNRKAYWGMSSWEWGITLFLAFFIAGAAVTQTLKVREAPFKEFMVRAGQIGLALEAFARDHGGRYPDDGMDNQSPPGLSPRYIEWREDWNIDYEVHDNGRGGKYIALEYLGRYKKNRSYHAMGLTRNPDYRKQYGRGQPIPGVTTRIWTFYEEAPIYQPPGS